MTDDATTIADYANSVLSFTAPLGEEYYYNSITLCVIDAVYSISVRYEGVKAVVKRYCEYFGLTRVRSDRIALPAQSKQESVSELCEKFDRLGLEHFAKQIFCNSQRTSTVNGILKADAVARYARVLRAGGIEYLQDVSEPLPPESLVREIGCIPGQRSGISLRYFWMLAGSDDLIKPDRMILRFLEGALSRTVLVSEAQPLLTAAVAKLKPKCNHLTPRLLDYKIWEYQRAQVTLKSSQTTGLPTCG